MRRAILGLLAGAGVVTLAVCLLDRRGEVMAQHVAPYSQPSPQPVVRRRVDRRAFADGRQRADVDGPRSPSTDDGRILDRGGHGQDHPPQRSQHSLRFDDDGFQRRQSLAPGDSFAVGTKVTFMAQKYYNAAEAAKILGVSPADINQMVLRRELYGYKDGADWKFKPEDIERVAAERGAGGHEDAGDNVLASEIELGHSDPGMSGTVIGADKKPFVRRERHPSRGKRRETCPGQGRRQRSQSSGKRHRSGRPASSRPEAKKGDAGSKVSQFEDLDMTLDHDLTLEDSNVAVSPGQARRRPTARAGDSAVDLGGKKLDDDDLVLGGSGTGSDISIGGDSGISLVDPADSGLSLEAP